MQQHKLWDLAGAIPDAQERVRAAAEKEGVSVEVWLQ